MFCALCLVAVCTYFPRQTWHQKKLQKSENSSVQSFIVWHKNFGEHNVWCVQSNAEWTHEQLYAGAGNSLISVFAYLHFAIFAKKKWSQTQWVWVYERENNYLRQIKGAFHWNLQIALCRRSRCRLFAVSTVDCRVCVCVNVSSYLSSQCNICGAKLHSSICSTMKLIIFRLERAVDVTLDSKWNKKKKSHSYSHSRSRICFCFFALVFNSFFLSIFLAEVKDATRYMRYLIQEEIVSVCMFNSCCCAA